MSTPSIDNATLLRALFQAGVEAVGGEQATLRALERFSLNTPVHLVAVGKAADAMAKGAITALGDKLLSGLVITKHGHLSAELRQQRNLECHESGHPVPDQASLLAGARLQAFVASIPSEHLLVFLVSGGSSALVEHLNEGLDLSSLKRETDKLLASGADIGEMNRQRKTLSRIKGGKLATQVQGRVLQLLISDVPGDRPGDIGSGLLVPDEATGMGAALPVWQNIDTHIIASSSIAQRAVATAATDRGLMVRQASGSLHGDMPDVVQRLSAQLTRPDAEPGVYIWGGEPTLVLPENPGRGGRNQHLALSMAQALATRDDCALLVCGTDGTDGPTDDAGGLLDQASWRMALRKGVNIEESLSRADAGNALEQIGALVTTGPTGTNVMDLAIAVVG